MALCVAEDVVFWFFREFRETRHAGNVADTAVLGCPSLAQPMETGMNGRRKRDGNGTTLAA